jgi:hypothetical protein
MDWTLEVVVLPVSDKRMGRQVRAMRIRVGRRTSADRCVTARGARDE